MTLLEKRNAKSEPKRRRRSKATAAKSASRTGSQEEAEDLADFIDCLAHEIFDNLREELQEMDYRPRRDSRSLQDKFSLPLTVGMLNLLLSISETLERIA